MNDFINNMNFFSLNNFDFLMLGIIGLSTVFGIVRGFIKSSISLFGWLVAMAGSMNFYFILEPIASKYISWSDMASVIAGLGLFVVIAIVMAIINNIFYIATEPICGGLLDRSVGLLFGFVRGCLLVSFIFFILLMLMPQLNQDDQNNPKASDMPVWAKNSETLLLLNKGAALVHKAMPVDFERKLRNALSNKPSQIDGGQEEGMSSELSSRAISEDTMSMLLSALPADVLDKISQDDLVLLQDATASPKEKVRILEDIKIEYQKSIEISESMPDNKEMIEKSIDDLIAFYNGPDGSES